MTVDSQWREQMAAKVEEQAEYIEILADLLREAECSGGDHSDDTHCNWCDERACLLSQVTL